MHICPKNGFFPDIHYDFSRFGQIQIGPDLMPDLSINRPNRGSRCFPFGNKNYITN